MLSETEKNITKVILETVSKVFEEWMDKQNDLVTESIEKGIISGENAELMKIGVEINHNQIRGLLIKAEKEILE